MSGKWFWNVYAFCYDAIARLIPYQQMMDDIVAALQLKSGMKILDAGCGTGNLEKWILKTGLGVEMVAVDFSEAMLKRAKKKIRSNSIQFQKLDLTKRLPFDDSSFDAIVSNNVLYALPNAEEVIGEFKRVLKPSGRMVICDPKPGSSFMSIFWSHLFSGGLLKALIRLVVLIGSVILIPELLLVAVANVVIELSKKFGDYHFWTPREWKRVLHQPIIVSTYAKQNWLLVQERR